MRVQHRGLAHARGAPGGRESVEFFEYCTQVAERGKVDAVFFADTPGLVMNEVQTTPMTTPMEPFILMTALARATERIGLIGTASTTYNDPYNLAHRIASLDLISRGRAGWNAVTTGGGLPARNFSHTEHPDHDARYARAAEFIDVVLGLWRGWEPGYHLGDKATGTFHDMGKIHELDHVGEHFQVLGPLNVPPSPQQHAVLVESGASEPGRAMAARCAEVIFASQYDIDEAIAFRTDIRRRMTANGRDPDAIKIMPGIVPVIGSTEAEAKAHWRQIGELIPIEPALRFVASRFQVDPADLDLDAPLRPELLPDASQIRGSRTQYEKVVAMAIRDDLTVRELIWTIGGRFGHPVVPVTPEQLADRMEEWLRRGAADGFNVMPDALPTGLEAFVDQVVPVLQDRGLFRKEYTGTTLREYFGLPSPIVGGSVSAV